MLIEGFIITNQVIAQNDLIFFIGEIYFISFHSFHIPFTLYRCATGHVYI
jgi:hypothetical protein